MKLCSVVIIKKIATKLFPNNVLKDILEFYVKHVIIFRVNGM